MLPLVGLASIANYLIIYKTKAMDKRYIIRRGGPKRPMYCPNSKKTIPGGDQFISAKYTLRLEFTADKSSSISISDSGIETSWSGSFSYLKSEALNCAAF